MADPDPQAPRKRIGFMGFVQQSQLLLAVAVAGSGLLFTFNQQRRDELALNRTAVEEARSEAIRKEFQEDPHNTLAAFKATYPQHAYCAALGFFIAENGRLNRSMLDRPDDQVRGMNDAVLLETRALAAAEGLGGARFDAFREASIGVAGKDDGGPGCAAIAAPRTLASRLAAPECLLAIDSFGENVCNVARWTAQRRDAIRLEQAAMAAAPPVPPASPEAVPTAAAPAPAVSSPQQACNGASPLVFTQFTDAADRPEVEGLRTALLAAGWQMAPVENTPSGRTTGDVRIYWEDQRDCAEALAAIVGALPAVARPIRVVSLADRYQGLPHGQLELWLPALH